jgi:hypothetical protein
VGEAIAGVPRETPLDRASGSRSAEADAATPGTADGTGSGFAGESVGAWFARQRRLRGIGLDELARVTRIPIRSLEQLEAGAFDQRPDGFARGFARTVAVALGLDPDDAASRLLVEPVAAPRNRVAAVRRAAIVVTGLCVVVGLLLGSARLASFLAERASQPPVGPTQSLPMRRDAVRELAIQAGVLAPDESGAARPLAPVAPVTGPPRPSTLDRAAEPADPAELVPPLE